MKHNQRNNRTQQLQLLSCPNRPEANQLAIYKCSWEVEPGTTREQIQRVVRAGLEPGISGSQGKRPNHWATLPPYFSLVKKSSDQSKGWYNNLSLVKTSSVETINFNKLKVVQPYLYSYRQQCICKSSSQWSKCCGLTRHIVFYHNNQCQRKCFFSGNDQNHDTKKEQVLSITSLNIIGLFPKMSVPDWLLHCLQNREPTLHVHCRSIQVALSPGSKPWRHWCKASTLTSAPLFPLSWR